MRYFVLSDIHGNLEAFQAVMEHAADQKYDEALVLGDLVGYGADPNAIVEGVIALEPTGIIRGNHDKVASGVESSEGFNMAARRAAAWTTDALTPAHQAYLANLPIGPGFIEPDIEICHGAPSDEDEYLFEAHDAARALRDTTRPTCFFGHTHVPVIYQLSPDNSLDVSGLDRSSGRRLALQPGCKYLINPGSVGQPRDGDPRAAYAVLDTESREVTLFRVAYAIEAAQAKIREAGLPDVLAARLATGR